MLTSPKIIFFILLLLFFAFYIKEDLNSKKINDDTDRKEQVDDGKRMNKLRGIDRRKKIDSTKTSENESKYRRDIEDDEINEDIVEEKNHLPTSQPKRQNIDEDSEYDRESDIPSDEIVEELDDDGEAEELSPDSFTDRQDLPESMEELKNGFEGSALKERLLNRARERLGTRPKNPDDQEDEIEEQDTYNRDDY